MKNLISRYLVVAIFLLAQCVHPLPVKDRRSKNGKRSRNRAAGDTVGFSVAMTTHLQSENNTDITVPFDAIQTNVGKGFDPETSHFVAPVPGLYFFTYSLMGRNTLHSLKVNDDIVVSSAGSNASGIHPMSSNSIVLGLDAGDSVYVILRSVEITNGGSHSLYSDDEKFCTFSGFLISERAPSGRGKKSSKRNGKNKNRKRKNRRKNRKEPVDKTEVHLAGGDFTF